MEHTATITSSVVLVRDLERSINFYREVFGCRVSLREEDAALLLDPGGFQLYLLARGDREPHPAGVIGDHILTWAVDSSEALREFEEALRMYGTYTDTHITGGVSVVEGRDPDGIQRRHLLPQSGRAPEISAGSATVQLTRRHSSHAGATCRNRTDDLFITRASERPRTGL
ncbi:VOC family protein [Microlunatus sp. Gsoil 973]|uniref:VOC family protein n=1 Tax=Microlunatus sp. Gsoil 973 TaxID=2672569 RepID=UPI0018A84CCF